MSAPETPRRPQHWVISVAAVILAMMAIQMSSLGFSPLLPAIRKELAASYSQMGLFTGMYGLIAIFISLPAGILAARFGEKRMLLSGLAVTALGLASLGLAHSYGVALASRAVWLVGYRFAFICVFTAMAVGTPEKYRSRTMGVLGALAALASVIGAPFRNTAGGVVRLERRNLRVRRHCDLRWSAVRRVVPSRVSQGRICRPDRTDTHSLPSL